MLTKKGEWIDSLIGCPSQCYLDVEDGRGQKLVLYLRWRHDDPWEAHLIKTPRGAAGMGGVYSINFKTGEHNEILGWDGDKPRTRLVPREEWSEDLLAKYNFFVEEDDVDAAKARGLEAADKFLSENPRFFEDSAAAVQ